MTLTDDPIQSPAGRHSPVFFDRERASSFDKQRAKLAPMKDALHFLMARVLAELPADARILCIGAGTGAEMIALAKDYPQWRFTAVEPAAAMLEICRENAEEHGFASRCTFHEGYLNTLPTSQPFDAATSILVSHFIMEPAARTNFFREIAARLRPGGYLVSADLAADISSSENKSLFEVWLRTLKYSDMPVTQIEKFRTSFGRDVAALPPQEVAAIIESGGFEAPVLFFQTMLIHAWYANKP